MADPCRCGATVPVQTGPGRPRRYCSTACRRGAEVERARLERLLESLEGRRIENRLHGTSGGAPASRVEQLDTAYLREINDLEARLRTLYDHEPERADHGRA